MGKQDEILTNELEKNVESISLDPKTKTLILCRAKLDDILNAVCIISDGAFHNDTECYERFEKAWRDSIKALDNIIIKLMSYNMCDYNYKSM